MHTILRLSALLACGTIIAGCNSSGGGGGVAGTGTTVALANNTLPLQATGKMLFSRRAATITATQNSTTKNTNYRAAQTSVVSTDRSAPGGLAIEVNSKVNPTPPSQFSPDLTDFKTTGTLAGGATVADLKDAGGRVYFENGNFGDPQGTSTTGSISGVSVYNPPNNGAQIALRDVTTLRYQGGAVGDAEANYGVGYAGTATTNMPGSGTATYRSFFEPAGSAYAKNGGTENLFLTDGKVELTADFGTGKVTGGVSGAKLVSYQNGATVNVSPDITGLAVDANITGSEYAGTAKLVDNAGAAVGTTTHSEVIGGFFGDAAAETAAAVNIEGNAQLDGAARDYSVSGVIGGTTR